MNATSENRPEREGNITTVDTGTAQIPISDIIFQPYQIAHYQLRYEIKDTDQSRSYILLEDNVTGEYVIAFSEDDSANDGLISITDSDVTYQEAVRIERLSDDVNLINSSLLMDDHDVLARDSVMGEFDIVVFRCGEDDWLLSSDWTYIVLETGGEQRRVL